MPLLNKIENVRVELEKINAARMPNLTGRYEMNLRTKLTYSVVGVRTDNRGIRVSAIIEISPNGPAAILEHLEARISFVIELSEPTNEEEIQEFVRNQPIINTVTFPYIDRILSDVTGLMNFTPIIISKIIRPPA